MLEARVRQSRVAARIHIEGFQPDPGRYMRATDLFRPRVASGAVRLVLAEARAAGCAIIGADVDGIQKRSRGDGPACWSHPAIRARCRIA